MPEKNPFCRSFARADLLLCALLWHGFADAAAGYIQLVLGQATVWERGGTQRPAQKGVQLYEGYGSTEAGWVKRHPQRIWWIYAPAVVGLYSLLTQSQIVVPVVNLPLQVFDYLGYTIAIAYLLEESAL